MCKPYVIFTDGCKAISLLLFVQQHLQQGLWYMQICQCVIAMLYECCAAQFIFHICRSTCRYNTFASRLEQATLALEPQHTPADNHDLKLPNFGDGVRDSNYNQITGGRHLKHLDQAIDWLEQLLSVLCKLTLPSKVRYQQHSIDITVVLIAVNVSSLAKAVQSSLCC